MSTFVNLSSVGVSPALPCTAVARTTMAQLTWVGMTTNDITIQGTLDNIGLYPTPAWTNISTSHYASSNNGVDGIMVTLLTPVAGLRLSSSAGTYTAGSAYCQLRILQQSVGVG
jgi:hypothetical protein